MGLTIVFYEVMSPKQGAPKDLTRRHSRNYLLFKEEEYLYLLWL
jgi:hypothetical protein